MNYYLITLDRLKYHLEYDVRKSALGVVNWFVDGFGDMNVILHIRGVDYLWIGSIDEIKEIYFDLFTLRNEVIGTTENLFNSIDVEEEPLEEVTMTDYLEMK